MESGKAQVLSAIAKQTAPFRAKEITDSTGLDRRLVNYHLTKFVEKNWLQHHGRFYVVVDLSQIIDQMTEALTVTDDSIKKPTSKGLVSQAAAKVLGDATQAVVYARVLGLDMADDMQAALNKDIDDTITYYRSLKRFLNNSRPSDRNAAKYFQGDTQLYDFACSSIPSFEPKHGKKEWLDSVDISVEVALTRKKEA